MYREGGWVFVRICPDLSGPFCHRKQTPPNQIPARGVSSSDDVVKVDRMRTDEQAMWRVKMDDDAEAFADLVARWEKPIQRLCARMLGDIHRGEDLTQEAFARVFARRKNYEPIGKFSTFLWRVALNLCYDELRKINRRGEFSLDEPRADDDA